MKKCKTCGADPSFSMDPPQGVSNDLTPPPRPIPLWPPVAPPPADRGEHWPEDAPTQPMYQPSFGMGDPNEADFGSINIDEVAAAAVAYDKAVQGVTQLEHHGQDYRATVKPVSSEKISGPNRPRTDLVPAVGIMAAARAMASGATKYGGVVQRKTPDDHYGALLRHLLAWRQGERVDRDTGLSHLDHVAARAMLLVYEALDTDGEP